MSKIPMFQSLTSFFFSKSHEKTLALRQISEEPIPSSVTACGYCYTGFLSLRSSKSEFPPSPLFGHSSGIRQGTFPGRKSAFN